ncbi:MAG: rRNA pseudouridine synthase [Clostridia bacterium]|nr:rRNA pseudouridine synthase [Clostridia bacterium]
MEQVRLQKYLAEAGIASRRKSEELIRDGRVTVNGVRISDMGMKVTGNDLVSVDGKKVVLGKNKIYIMLNKPVGVVTTVKDQFGRPTVIDLVKNIDERVYPVGRLDYDTSGLLILTNDGEFTYRLTHPKHEMKKVYLAEVEGIPEQSDLEQFRNGIRIEDYTTSPAEIKIVGTGKAASDKRQDISSLLQITIHEGKNRQVRKMCEAIKHPVIKLKRIAIGDVKLGDLEEGKWRYLSKEEIRWLNI